MTFYTLIPSIQLIRQVLNLDGFQEKLPAFQLLYGPDRLEPIGELYKKFKLSLGGLKAGMVLFR